METSLYDSILAFQTRYVHSRRFLVEATSITVVQHTVWRGKSICPFGRVVGHDIMPFSDDVALEQMLRNVSTAPKFALSLQTLIIFIDNS